VQGWSKRGCGIDLLTISFEARTYPFRPASAKLFAVIGFKPAVPPRAETRQRVRIAGWRKDESFPGGMLTGSRRRCGLNTNDSVFQASICAKAFFKSGTHIA
jgi:hypothetical protein